ncbi:MAG: DNA gyrase inhibitor YacG [Alphaproteobacteria bacterium]|nr:DNA gyrase inhibitor YacG [Alphaproteobacteria bacterium]
MSTFQAPSSNDLCPLCHKTTDHHFRPFCSKRCKEVDLGRWFQETYRVPSNGDGNEVTD